MYGVYGRGNQRTGRQGGDFQTPYNLSQGGRIYGSAAEPCTSTSSRIGGIPTMARPETGWSLGHRENMSQSQQGSGNRSQSMSQFGNSASQPQMTYYPPQQQQARQQQQQQAVSYQQAPSQQQQQQPPQPGSTTVYAGNVFGNTGGAKSKPTMGIPPELEGNPNVNYVRMNWEDVLGGKDGLAGLKVSMAPSAGDGQNRQIRIGMGGQGQPDDGSTPLKIVSFQPIENYPGQMTSGGGGSAMAQPNYGNSGGGAAGSGMPSISNPIMVQNQSAGSTYMQQQRPGIGGGNVMRTQSSPSTFTYNHQANRLPGGPMMQMGSYSNARGPGTQAGNPRCGNQNCAACQFQQPYTPFRRR